MRDIAEQKELYANIRKKNAETILGDGLYWWATFSGIPSQRFSREQIPDLVEYLRKTFAERGPPLHPVGLSNCLDGRKLNWEEMQEFSKEIAEEVN